MGNVGNKLVFNDVLMCFKFLKNFQTKGFD